MAFCPLYSYDMSVLPLFLSLPSFLLYNQVVSTSPFCIYLIYTFIPFPASYSSLILLLNVSYHQFCLCIL